MKKYYLDFAGMVRVLAICLFFFSASFTLVTAQTRNTPESQTKDFYSWYLKAMAKGQDPTKNKTVIKSYLSLRFSRWHYSKPGRKPNSDVFFNSRDWNAAWADNIEVTEAVYITDNNAALHVMLSAPPEEFVMKLLVNLVKERGKWKIDGVKGSFD